MAKSKSILTKKRRQRLAKKYNISYKEAKFIDIKSKKEKTTQKYQFYLYQKRKLKNAKYYVKTKYNLSDDIALQVAEKRLKTGKSYKELIEEITKRFPVVIQNFLDIVDFIEVGRTIDNPKIVFEYRDFKKTFDKNQWLERYKREIRTKIEETIEEEGYIQSDAWLQEMFDVETLRDFDGNIYQFNISYSHHNE